MSEQSLAHTRWDCTYHIVWIPKYRKKVLYGECRTEMKAILRQLLEMKKIEIVEGAMCSDHVHLSIRIPPKYAVAEIMGFLKGKSALMLFDRHPEWRRRMGRDRSFWARGYYVSTIGLNEEVIKKYIQDQEDSDCIGAE
ncbi:IS200/IS605 family transposase ISDha13 [anaerobic digester metagenome]